MLLVSVLALLCAAAPVDAQALDPASVDALTATLKVLLDHAARGAAVGSDRRAGAADQNVRTLTGSDAITQEVYELAAQIFGELARASGGDLQKMVEALERGRTDPAGFAAMLSPHTRERLREISTKISDRPR